MCGREYIVGHVQTFFFFINESVLNNFLNFYCFLQGLRQTNVTLEFPSKINKLTVKPSTPAYLLLNLHGPMEPIF